MFQLRTKANIKFCVFVKFMEQHTCSRDEKGLLLKVALIFWLSTSEYANLISCLIVFWERPKNVGTSWILIGVSLLIATFVSSLIIIFIAAIAIVLFTFVCDMKKVDKNQCFGSKKWRGTWKVCKRFLSKTSVFLSLPCWHFQFFSRWIFYTTYFMDFSSRLDSF